MPKPIPKWAFQMYALALLVLAWGGAGFVAVSGAWPMPVLAPWVGTMLAAFLVWVVASLFWMVAVVPVRLFTSGFETLGEALARSGASSLGEAVTLERQKLERAAQGTRDERLRHHALFAVVGGCLALVLGFATAVNLELWPERVYFVFPIGSLACAGLAVVYAARALVAFASRR